jgi:FAD/FMN-containing dehydrogenase
MLSSAPGDAQGGTSIVVLGTAFSDSAEQAAHALSPLETCPALATALSRHVADPTPFSALHSIIDSLSPEGHRYAADTLWSNAGTVDVLQALGRVPQPPSPTSLVVAVMHAPRPQREAVADTAFSMSGAFWITCYEFWDDDADDDAHTTWVRQVMETFAPLEIGHYVGEVDLLAAKDRASRSFSEQSWERLQTLRANLDPDNVFHSFLQP